MGDEKQQQNPQNQERNDFTLRTRQSKWNGAPITLKEPPLVEGLALADEYSDMVMETVNGKNLMRLRIRESEYVAAVLSRYMEPAIDVSKLPARMYPAVRKLINEWEDFSGMRALRETIRAQISEAE